MIIRLLGENLDLITFTRATEDPGVEIPNLGLLVEHARRFLLAFGSIRELHRKIRVC